MKILVTGKSGQLGRVILEEAAREEIEIIPAGRTDFDITDRQSIARFIKKTRPDLILNTAAFTDVNRAEDNPIECFEVNAFGPAYLGLVANETGTRLIHISTNFIFDGSIDRPYRAGDLPNPLNTYGKSKYLGDLGAEITNPSNTLICRTSGLFSEYGSNFIHHISRQLKNTKNEIKLIGDQFTQPTYARDLAKSLLLLAKSEQKESILHLVNSGVASWFDFGVEFIAQYSDHSHPVMKVSQSEFSSALLRPKSAVLDQSKLAETLPLRRSWQESLKECVERMKLKDA